MRTNELVAGPVLDSLVAMAQGWVSRKNYWEAGKRKDWPEKPYLKPKVYYQPSTNGAQAFELIERYGITVGPSEIAPNTMWTASLAVYVNGKYVDNYLCTGSTPAEAICKSVVASKWGDTIPGEIMELVK